MYLTHEQASTGYVYFILDTKNEFFKIGHTKYLLKRITELKKQIDFQSSFYVSCRSKDRHLIEKAAHDHLRNYRRSQSGDGYSEWFLASAIEKALDFADALSEGFKSSPPRLIPYFESIECIGDALIANGAQGDPRKLGKLALEVGDQTATALQIKVYPLRRLRKSRDMTNPAQVEIAEYELDREKELLAQMNLVQFMTAEIRHMVSLAYTLNRNEYKAFTPESSDATFGFED